MRINKNLITFVVINKNYFEITVLDYQEIRTFFNQKFSISNKIDNDTFKFFKEYFIEKILLIEKKIGIYIENLVLIIEKNFFLEINLSYLEKINQSLEIKEILKEGLKQFRECYYDYVLSHYIFNVQHQKLKKSEPEIDNSNNIKYLEMKFICIEKNILGEFKQILKLHQIYLKNIYSYDYLKNIKSDNETIIDAAKKALFALNNNEVKIQKKTSLKAGFFEYFFNYFK